MSEVLVLVEKSADGVRKGAFELLTAARRLGEPSAVVFGGADDATVSALGQYGAAKVYAVAGDEAEQYLSVPKADALTELAKKVQPAAILMSSGPEGKDVAGRLAVRLDSGLLTDVIDVKPGSGTVQGVQQVFAGAWQVTSEVNRGTPIITVRPNSIGAEAAPATPSVENVEVTYSEDARGAKVDERAPKKSSGRPDLIEAEVIVTGGRGVGSQEGFGIIESTADAFGAAVGATRAVTDSDWVSHDLQIGQTGKTVAPNLYLAAGVSGAIQHRAGMQSSKTIVSVNKDAKAPIFAVSDFGVVGDLHKVLPALIDEVNKRKG